MEWLSSILGIPSDVLILLLLGVAGGFAGFVDSIVGGGGHISVVWLWGVINYLVFLELVAQPLLFLETAW